MSKERWKRLALYGLAFMVAGIAYGMFVHFTGIGIPCVFHLITGWKCPGCGVTHMCIALLQLDIRGAFESHPVLLIQLPFYGILFVRYAISYVKKGRWDMNMIETGILFVCVISLIAFAVYRNVYGI